MIIDRSLRILIFIAAILLLWPKFIVAGDCKPVLAVLESAEGRVEILSEGEDVWHAARKREALCPGDTIRTGKSSRALLVLNNQTQERLDAMTSVIFPEQTGEGFWVKILKGITLFMSRELRTLKVTTPYSNAAVEGTEFLVKVDDKETVLNVFEGMVVAYNEAGSLSVSSGQSAVVRKGEAPVIRVVVRPRDAVQWTLYYPPILQFDPLDFEGQAETPWLSDVALSIELYQQGRLTEAFEVLERVPEDVSDTRFFTYRASLSLAVGRVREAMDDIDKALTLKPDNGDALGLKAVIAVVQNDKERALELANQASALSPNTPGPLLALSYAWQAKFRLERARAAVEAAVELAPDNALAWSRLAEMHLMSRNLDDALEAVQKAVDINPNVSRTQTVLGYTMLIYLNIEAAKVAFNHAITLDQASPLARLGLGLALIHEGDLEKGRREIEIAVALDPDNALIRSYLGKAYYEERRDMLAVEQYSMAKALDPLDPTPHFYNAIRNQTENQPVNALQDIQKSFLLNNNRAVYRSRLLLDEDLAVRGASMARIYNDLGFEQLALVEGWKSMVIDPGNHSVHRLLADSYADLPRHEIARVSELLQAQLLQPININPVSPRLAETNLLILEQAGLASASFNEFNPLFMRERLAIQINSVVGNNDSWGEESVLSGQKNNLSFSLGQFHHKTSGFRENNDIEQDIYDIFTQFRIWDNMSLQFEFRRREIDNGDILLFFDNDSYSPDFRQGIDHYTARFGLNYQPRSDHIVVFSTAYNDKTDKQSDLLIFPGNPLGYNSFTRCDGYNIELQHIYRGKKLKTVLGFGYAELDDENRVFLDGIPFDDSKEDTDYENAYLYNYLALIEGITVTIGLTYDNLNKSFSHKDQFNPKLGLILNPTTNTTVRVAGFSSLKRPVLTNQTIEPTQIAGFNQFFDDTDGADAKRYGIGFDHRVTPSLFYGIEFTGRELEKYILKGVTSKEDQDERFHRAYLYWTPMLNLGLSAEYQFEDFSRDFTVGEKNESKPAGMTTQLIPLQARFFFPNGLFGNVQTSYVNQEVELVSDYGVDNFRDDFWITDISFGYRFPQRRGLMSIYIGNVFDEKFSFQGTNFETGTPRPPRFQPDRGIYAKVNLWF